MLIRLHIYGANLRVHIQVLLIHSIAKHRTNLQLVLQSWSREKKGMKLFRDIVR